MASSRRWKAVSNLPPKWADTIPRAPPATVAINRAPMPMPNERRAPQTTRAQMSRPALSVPNQCSQLGAAFPSLALGLPPTPPPRCACVPSRFRRAGSFSRCLSVADARVEPGVAQVDHKIREHEGQRDHQDDALDDGKVGLLERRNHEKADPRYGNNALENDVAAEERGDQETDDGEHGDHRVLEGGPADDGPLLQALRPGRPHVVLSQH